MSEDKLNPCMTKFLLFATLILLVCLFFEWFPYPLVAFDKLYHLIVAIPEPSIITIWAYHIIDY